MAPKLRSCHAENDPPLVASGVACGVASRVRHAAGCIWILLQLKLLQSDKSLKL